MRTPVSALVTPPCAQQVLVPHEALVGFVAAVFERLGLAPQRAAVAADALCYGDLTGMDSHGVANLTRLYLPLFREGRADPAADLEIVGDRAATVRVDAHRALGLWAAAEAMDLAVERAAAFGVGVVSVFDGTHFGCAGYHAGRAAAHDMVGIVASNCGGQRIARPPFGRVTMLGTNPLSIAAPGADDRPYVLDMSTTVVPTGRIRAAARAGRPVPEGWLVDDSGAPVTDPAAFDRGEAHIPWLGNRPETGSYKGYGLSLMVEVLAAVASGAACGPSPEALGGDGRPSGRDDDIGYFVMAFAPGTLRDVDAFRTDAATMFGSLLACPTTAPDARVRYPGWVEAERAERRRRFGVPLAASLYEELREVAHELGLTAPEVGGLA
jgi:LDH2 family malate/lactate/ureidoglycolate dehydrogenase